LQRLEQRLQSLAAQLLNIGCAFAAFTRRSVGQRCRWFAVTALDERRALRRGRSVSGRRGHVAATAEAMSDAVQAQSKNDADDATYGQRDADAANLQPAPVVLAPDAAAARQHPDQSVEPIRRTGTQRKTDTPATATPAVEEDYE
jgi:hypothetical protein